MKHPVLVIGQSHVIALRAAARRRRERAPLDPRLRVIHTLETSYAPELVGSFPNIVFAAALERAIRDQLNRHAPIVISAMGGNFHNSLALIQDVRPFDFQLSHESSPPQNDEAEPLAERLVADALRAGLARDFARLEALHACVGDFFHLESPPPVLSSAFLAARADEYFQRRGLTHHGVAHPGLRYRMWRLSSRLMRAKVEQMGCRYLPVPTTVRDAAGFLRMSYAGDATHGNEAYGEAMIQMLEMV